jgi:hypothetical protein
MTQQQGRPRTSRGHYFHKNNDNADIRIHVNFADRQDTVQIDAKKFVPHPPGMPQREESFINQTSPRRRRYSAAKKDESVDDNDLLKNDFYTSSHQK